MNERAATRLRRRRRYLGPMGTGIAVALVALVSTADAASVDTIVPTPHYPDECIKGDTGDGMTVCLTDNANVSYFMDNTGDDALEAGNRTVVTNAITQQYGNPTDLQVAYDSTPVYDGAGETDIIYREAGTPNGSAGIYWCNDPVDGSAHRCDQGYVTMRATYLNDSAYNYSLVCHETGHAVGLVHGSDAGISDNDSRLGCMVLSTWPTGLGALNRENVNDVY